MHKQLSEIWRLRSIALSLIVLIGLMDQLSKHWVLGHLMPYAPYPICPHFNLTLAFNTGAAFSFLSGTQVWRMWFFVGTIIVVGAFLIRWLFRLKPSQSGLACALGLILGGALSNLIDRLTLFQVVDFLDVYYGSHHWPVFNIADSAICIGAGLLWFYSEHSYGKQ